MTPENITRLKTLFRDEYHDSIDTLPDGWVSIIEEFLAEIDAIGDLTDAVSCRFEQTPSGLKAFCFPEMSRWLPEDMNALKIAQRTLYGLSQQSCEVCGEPASGRTNDRFLCASHGDSDAS